MHKFVKTALAAALVLPQISPLGMAVASANSLPPYEGTGIQCPAGTVFGWVNDTPVCFDTDLGGDTGWGNPEGREGGGGSPQPKTPEEQKREREEDKKKRCEADKARDIEISNKMFDSALENCRIESGMSIAVTILDFSISLPVWMIKNGYGDCALSANNARKAREFQAGISSPACN